MSQSEPLLGQPSRIYKITADELSGLFAKPQTNDVAEAREKQKVALREHESVNKIIGKLSSDANCGIIGDDRDLLRRTKIFGENTMPTGTPASFFDSLKDIFMERLTIVAMVTALLSAITGGIEKGWGGTIEGFGLLIFLIIVNVIITSFDFVKDDRFLKLQQILKEEKVSVIRGKAFQTRSLSVWKLVVGDIIMLNAGDRCPADCLLVESSELTIADEDVELEKRDADYPFVYAGSFIKKGSAKLLVAAVGKNSSRGVKEAKLDMNQDSALNQKLDAIASRLMLFALITAAVIFVQLLIFLFINIANTEDKWKTFIGGLPRRFNQAVVLAIVSFPEGLALTFQLSMAFVVMQMYKRDNVLVRDLGAPEIMGQAEEIIVGKTGTITRAEMSVKWIKVASREISNSRKNTFLNTQLNRPIIELIKESILFNTQARIETNETYYVPVGNSTDTCMINFLQDAEIPVHLVVQRRNGRQLMQRGFKKEERTHVTAVQNYSNPEVVDIFVKGAPEEVVDMCAGEYDPTPSEDLESLPNIVEEFDKDGLLENIRNSAETNNWRMISYAHCQVDIAEFKGEDEALIDFQAFESNLASGAYAFNHLCTFGLKDSLRQNVQSAITYATKQANLNVRLVSNDLKETVIQTALKAGILTEDELTDEYAVMSGEDFWKTIGGLEQCQAGEVRYDTLLNMQHFDEISKRLRVLYRATSDHKDALVVGLRSLRLQKIHDEITNLEDEKKQRNMIENEASKIIVTGEGVNDVDALNSAQVGIAMCDGVASAKNAAKLVLTNNNFRSVLQSVLWGRNIYQNVTRFLQFQMTVNLSCILVVFIGVFFYSEMPMSSAQLLWINLIMDVIAAIALGTEPPMPTLVKGNPRHQTSLLKQKQVWRQIIGISIYNTLVILLLFIFGPNMVAIDEGIPWNGYAKVGLTRPANCSEYPKALLEGQAPQTACKEYRQSAAKGTLLTYVFNTFVFLQIFNLINSRKIGIDDKNVIESFSHNFYFLLAFFGMMIVQVILVQYLYWVISATPLSTRSEWGAALTVGSSVLLISFILKLTPKAWVDKIPDIVDENTKPKNAFVDQTEKFLKGTPDGQDTPTDDGDNVDDEPPKEDADDADGGESHDAEANGYSRVN